MTTLQAILDPDELPAPKTDADISKRWVQVNVRFFSEPDGSSERIPWATLGSALANMRERNLFLWSFLTRKPPGMRLRFASDHIALQLLPALVSWLERVEEDGIIRCYRFEHYEPEIHRFGGPDGMEIAHFAFDADTRLILSYYGNPSLRETLVPQIYSILTLDDLFSQATDDPAETWDIWKRLEGLVRAVDPSAFTGESVERRALELSEKGRTMSAAQSVQNLLRDVRPAHGQIAASLRATRAANRLRIGVREWLAGAAVFHWNRLGLTTADLAALLLNRTAALEGCP